MFQEMINSSIEGHVKIWDAETGQVLVDKRNAIHNENLSIALARSIADLGGNIYELHFGNGGTVINDLGVITYRTPNITGQDADLYSPTYFKVVDKTDAENNNAGENYITTSHDTGVAYSDIIVNALIGYTEPNVNDTTFNLAGAPQSPIDNAADFSGEFVFDEIGLKSKGTTLNTGLLLTHIVFHPVQKSANRQFRIQYTLRIRVASSPDTIPPYLPEPKYNETVSIYPSPVVVGQSATITIMGGKPNTKFTYSGDNFGSGTLDSTGKLTQTAVFVTSADQIDDTRAYNFDFYFASTGNTRKLSFIAVKPAPTSFITVVPSSWTWTVNTVTGN